MPWHVALYVTFHVKRRVFCSKGNMADDHERGGEGGGARQDTVSVLVQSRLRLGVMPCHTRHEDCANTVFSLYTAVLKKLVDMM